MWKQHMKVTDALKFFEEFDDLGIDPFSDIENDDEVDDPSYIFEDNDLDEDSDETREEELPASEKITGAVEIVTYCTYIFFFWKCCVDIFICVCFWVVFLGNV